MFETIKRTHNAAMFDTRIGLAAKYPDDRKLSLWVTEAFTYFQKLTLTDAHLHVWDDLKLCLKFKEELEIIFEALVINDPAEPAMTAVQQMHFYFSERLRMIIAYHKAQQQQAE